MGFKVRRRLPRLGVSLLTTAGAFMSIAAAGLAAAGPALAGVSGAVSTTDDPGYVYTDGSGYTAQACLNGQGVNCNIYQDKRDVFLSGLPVSAALGTGNYFFAVLDPGGQANPNDGAAGNLSSSHDDWTNREFSVDGSGAITYSGTHQFDGPNNKISLFPYDDTSNPGGVYILAVCAVPSGAGTTTGSGTPGVSASECKYDAFKVGTGTPGPASPLTITKDASGSDTTTYSWTITKAVDKTKVNVPAGGTATFTYTVTVTHDGGTISNVQVTGTIDVFNPNVDGGNNPVPVAINGVTDQLSDGTTCDVAGGGAQTLSQMDNKFSYTCNLSLLPQGELDNTATVSWPDQPLTNGTELAAGQATFTFTNIAFTPSLADNCVAVTDSVKGALGTTCVGDPNPMTFTSYSETFPAPTGTCVEHDNTATFTTNTSGTTGSASQGVTVCGGADLTVSKTATPSFTRKFTWGISKSVDHTKIAVTPPGSATFNYTVNVTHDAGTDSDWQVSGIITVANPNNWEDVTLSNGGLTDIIDNGGSCTVQAGAVEGGGPGGIDPTSGTVPAS